VDGHRYRSGRPRRRPGPGSLPAQVPLHRGRPPADRGGAGV